MGQFIVGADWFRVLAPVVTVPTALGTPRWGSVGESVRVWGGGGGGSLVQPFDEWIDEEEPADDRQGVTLAEATFDLEGVGWVSAGKQDAGGGV